MREDEGLVKGVLVIRVPAWQANVLVVRLAIGGYDHPWSLGVKRLVRVMDGVHGLLHTYSKGSLNLTSKIVDLLDARFVGVESFESHKVFVRLVLPQDISLFFLLFFCKARNHFICLGLCFFKLAGREVVCEKPDTFRLNLLKDS